MRSDQAAKAIYHAKSASRAAFSPSSKPGPKKGGS
jgi:hypothetical protein